MVWPCKQNASKKKKIPNKRYLLKQMGKKQLDDPELL